jgi:AbiV family abortive infection protein
MPFQNILDLEYKLRGRGCGAVRGGCVDQIVRRMTADHAKCLDELASNARRLLADAELVLAKGSHQTASSLAILAMEEAGKFFHIKWTMDDKHAAKRNALKLPARGPRAHQTKQAIATSFYAARVSIEATKEFVRNIGYPDDDQTMFNFLTALHLPNEKAAQALEKLVEFVADKMATDERSQLMRVAQMGGIDLSSNKDFTLISMLRATS